jgi:hypothetical protein
MARVHDNQDGNSPITGIPGNPYATAYVGITVSAANIGPFFRANRGATRVGLSSDWLSPSFSGSCCSDFPLVPKLCFGTHFREALLRGIATSRSVCEDTSVWKRFRVCGAIHWPCGGRSRASGWCVPKQSFGTREVELEHERNPRAAFKPIHTASRLHAFAVAPSCGDKCLSRLSREGMA